MINIVNGAKYDSLLYISCSTLGTLTLRCKTETSKITAGYCSQSSLYSTRPATILNIVLIQLKSVTLKSKFILDVTEALIPGRMVFALESPVSRKLK